MDFYYKIEDLHNLANRESVYALDSLDPGLTDRHVLGMDEDVFFKRMLKTAGSVVFKRIHRRARGLTTPYQFDVTYDPGTGGISNCIVFSLVFPDNFDMNLKDAVDSKLQECLVYHVLAGWFSKQRRNVLAEEYKKFYQDNEDELKSLIEMRTLVRRPSVFWDRYFVEEE